MFLRSEPLTLVEVVHEHARERGSSVAFVALATSGGDQVTLTCSALDRAAAVVAADLQQRGLSGKRVLILCPSGLDYVVALLGCLYAGATAVPAYPPTRTNLARVLPRLRAICADAGAEAALATADVQALWHSKAVAGLETLDLFIVDWREKAGPGRVPTNAPDPDAMAILQYTSGSTSAPKGVALTHRQLLANLEMSRASGHFDARDVLLSWLPPYHDMGLMGGIFLPMFLGAQGVLMAADAFIRKPRRWLEAATTYRASVLMAPNFAFDLCVRRVPREARAGLDLAAVRLVYNGAEPIHAPTLEAFGEAFAPHGFRSQAFQPCYGMAEATLIVSSGAPDAHPVIRSYLADELVRNQAVAATRAEAEVAHDSPNAKTRRLVGCGRALLDERILIVEPETRSVLPPRQVGEIWVQSRSVASGYWNRPEETEQTFRARTNDGDGPFLRTGDLGFFDDGELFITGRRKDLVILRGLNHYPQDIERTVQAVDDALVADAGAAFSIEAAGHEQLVVVQELDKRQGVDADALLSRVPEAIREEHEITPVEVVLIKRGSLLKTSSGKVQRRATNQAYLAGELQVVARWHISDAARGPAAMKSAAVLPHEPAATTEKPPSATTEERSARIRTQSSRRAREREREIADWLCAYLGQRIERSPDAIDPHEPLARYGVDSLVAAELVEALEQWLGRALPATLSYDNPTVASLARALAEWGTEAPPLATSERQTHTRPARRDVASEDPIAIVGMACRFPGAADLKSFWNMLRHGVDAITEVPADRWDVAALYAPAPGTPGKMCSKWGGFVAGIDQFDAAFFGISPREAARIDPQQRMFLEVAWEALEDAGQSPAALAGSHTGVFAGVCTNDYATLYSRDLRLIDADYGTGNSPSIVANRLSYVLDLKGPSEAIDSACSSSLVALQHACQSLRNLECELAIVGGVNAVLAPESNVYFSQVRALAKDGRCKAFDSRADGFVRSEGAGVVVVKRLSRALADGDRVYALVAGSAVNHDGRSNGILAPNGIAQQDVIRRALSAASASAADIDYVEAHGVGTPVADAVELQALGAVLADERREAKLRVGSAKTNVGHLEAASGMVSLIKVALALHHEELPPQLHLQDPHPDIGLALLPIEIPTVPVAWRRGSRPRYAGVSTFGFGGTNAHVIVREAPLHARMTARCERPCHILPLSAKDGAALRQLASRMAHRLGLATSRNEGLGDIAFTASVGRAHLPHRLAVTGRSADEIREQLERFVHGRLPHGVRSGAVKNGARALVGLVFDEATLVPGMLQELYQQHPPLRQAVEACDHWLRTELEHPLSALLCAAPTSHAAELLQRPMHAHAALVTMHYALHSLLRVWGVEPIAVYGSGAGEYSAAAATGVMSWQEAVVLAARRGRVLEGLLPGAERTSTVRAFKADLTAIDYLAPSVPFVSASLGRAFTLDELPDETHWARHLYHEPQASNGRDAWLAEGCALHVGLGPCGTFDIWTHVASDAWLTCVGADSWRTLLDALATLYVSGAAIDWHAFDAPYPRRKLSLPTYPFQRQRHWLDFPTADVDGSAVAPATSLIERPSLTARPSLHPLIGRVRVYVAPESGIAPKTDTIALPRTRATGNDTKGR